MLKRTTLMVLSSILAFSSTLLAQETRDLGFEKGVDGNVPSGWSVPSKGWKAELTKEKAASGSYSVKLHLPGKPSADFGNVMQSVPANEFVGKHVKLTAKMLVVGTGKGQMWLRVDRKDGSMGAFDNMDDRPILAGDWQDAIIEEDIDADGEKINFGFLSLRGATVFIDDVQLTVSNEKKPAPSVNETKPLSPRGLENLTAAAKLLSYVRFFHPSDQVAGVASWDHFAVSLMEAAEPASDAKNLAKRFRAQFESIAPTIDIWDGPPEKALGSPQETKAPDEFAIWKHVGVGSIGTTLPQALYQSTVEKVSPNDLPGGPQAAFVIKSLGGGVSCRIPIAVPVDEGRTIPHGKTPEAWASKKGLAKLTGRHRATRFAGVALGWGIFQHFYPYFDAVQTDWNAALPAALTKAATDADEISYLYTLRELIAKLHDGHGSVYNQRLGNATFLPLAVEWAGKDLVVVGVHASATENLAIGDVVVSIDGKKIEDCYAEVSKMISAATDGWSRYGSQRALVVNLPTKNPASVVVRKSEGTLKTLSLSRIKEETPNTATVKRPANGTELSPGIVYFNLDGAHTPALEEELSELSKAKAVLFDLRGYPGSAGYQLMQHLIREPATSARWCIPITRQPDRESVEWNETGRWDLQPAEPYLGGKIAFLTDGRAISYAESVMGIVEHYKFGEIIGSTTAGTNGNVNPFVLPGGYQVSWTGMRVLKHDGTRHHGVGIAPTIPVVPTAKGVREGRDEVLERAVEAMKAKVDAETSGIK